MLERVEFCLEILEFMSKHNTNFHRLGEFMIETFKSISLINFTKFHLGKKKNMRFESKIMHEILNEKFDRIPYFELVEGLLDECATMDENREIIMTEFDDRVSEMQKIVKKLLMIKERFDRKEELIEMKRKLEDKDVENSRLRSDVRTDSIRHCSQKALNCQFLELKQFFCSNFDQ